MIEDDHRFLSSYSVEGMLMKKLFIAYSHADHRFVDKLHNSLNFSHLNVVIDKKILNPGDELTKIFEEIGTSDYLLCVLSLNSINSNWVKKELKTAILKEIDNPKFTVIPVVAEGENWDTISKTISGELREALRTKYILSFDGYNYEENIKSLLQFVSANLYEEELYSKIQGLESDNPFRRVRTEYFEDIHILAGSFAEPEKALYDRIIEVKPAIIEGGRGSGKTMILKSLQALTSLYRNGKKNFKEGNLKRFGVYCRLTQGAFSTSSGNILKHINKDEKISQDIAERLFISELILRLIQALIEELQLCISQSAIFINASQETVLVNNISRQILPNVSEDQYPRDFEAARKIIEKEMRNISDFLSRKILGSSIDYSGIFLTKEILSTICENTRQCFPELASVTIYFLLDEYENLLPFQKVVVNTLVKWSSSKSFTIKIAAKKTGFQDPQTLEGQELEQGHDYSPIDLDYDISNSTQRKQYKDLLIKICEKILENEGFKIHDINVILEENLLFDGFPESEIEEKINSMANFDGESKKEYFHRLQNAAVYRLLYPNKKKQFAGFDDFVLLSSGITRYFLELCGMSYYYAIQSGMNIKDGDQIKRVHQTKAVYVLSSYYLSTIRKNIASDGPRIQQFVIDMGDIFRKKLLNHLSEPEAARISIKDPHALEDPSMKEIRRLLDLAEMHSVLQIHKGLGLGGIRPKHSSEVQPREYLINRIYAPILEFSLYPRWRTNFTCKEIKDMFDPTLRQSIKGKLIRRVKESKKDTKIKDNKQKTLSE